MMNEGLFRKQAVDEFKQRISGEPLPPLPATWSWMAVLVLLVLGTTVGFLAVNEYARKEKAVGWLRYASGEFAVIAPVSGTVEDINVEEGHSISQGAPLFIIRTEQTSTEGNVFGAEYTRSIEAEIELIEELERNAASTLLAQMVETQALRFASVWFRSGIQRSQTRTCCFCYRF